tara:strand:+ start:423 stop:752 length:330 start_codon:yes stop_codon:yes gene_type:complete
MTRERYLKMCEQMGQEPKQDEIPPDMDDFPQIAINAMITFSQLGDRVYPDIGYIGKDFTNLPYYLDMYGVESVADKELFLEILTYLDSRAIKHSQDLLKREREKLKRKK